MADTEDSCQECFGCDGCICGLDCGSDSVLDLLSTIEQLQKEVAFWKQDAENTCYKLNEARERNSNLQLALDKATWRDE